jgi:TPP-dependent pyruvate/acetoin dehydrogenase alpha subunit
MIKTITPFDGLNEETNIDLLNKMLQIRFFEEAAGRLYTTGKVKGGIHASIGQEAVAVGVCDQLRQSDYIVSTHRGHGHHIAKGAEMGKLMAEILGKETGYCRGRGGSMHVAAFDVGSLGAFPVVAAGVPSAIGASLSCKIRNVDNIVVAFFGEGALGQGVIYEAFNMAAIWELPLIFVCENNQYAVSTRVDTTIAINDFTGMAEKHGLAAEDIDGQDLSAVYNTASTAIKRARDGGGPTFIHAITYRFEGHYFGEPQTYRTQSEVDEARKSRDPIKRYAQFLTEKGVRVGLDNLEEKARNLVSEAVGFAEASPNPHPEEFEEYVYA